jgi:hypothetical protein
MLKRTLLIMLLSPGLAGAAESTDKVSVNLAGVGARTCAYWLSDQTRKAEGTVWIYGFWSGLNYVAAASDQDQSKASGAAMVAAVETACKHDPTRVLASAAWSAYLDLDKK